LRTKTVAAISNLQPANHCANASDCSHNPHCDLVSNHALQVVTEQNGDQWFGERHLRITESVAYDVTHSSDSNVSRVLHSLLWAKPFTNVAVQYGKDNEANALLEFGNAMSKDVPRIVVYQTGHWESSTTPELGCSPDGIALDANSSDVFLVEIKCPYILRNCAPRDFGSKLSKKQINNFCLTEVDQKLMLKRQHKYYFQVQMQMAVMHIRQYYFVVWSPHGLWWEMINYDSDLCSAENLKMLISTKCTWCPSTSK